MKISVEQLKQLNKEEYILIDIRDAEEAFKNPIENSVVLSGKSVLSKEFDATKKIVVVCAQGYVSDFVAQKLQEKGYDAYSIDGGYVSIVMDKMNTNVWTIFVLKSKEVLLKRTEEKFGLNLRRPSVIMSLSKKAIVLRYVYRVEKIQC